MPKGSVVIYLASTLHSGGENRSREKRWGLNIDYNLASLKQEENMFLSCPPEIAAKLPAELQALLGYTMPGPSLLMVVALPYPLCLRNPPTHPPTGAATVLIHAFSGGRVHPRAAISAKVFLEARVQMRLRTELGRHEVFKMCRAVVLAGVDWSVSVVAVFA